MNANTEEKCYYEREMYNNNNTPKKGYNRGGKKKRDNQILKETFF